MDTASIIIGSVRLNYSTNTISTKARLYNLILVYQVLLIPLRKGGLLRGLNYASESISLVSERHNKVWN